MNSIQKLVIEEGYYWEDFSTDLKTLIKKCLICTVRIQKKIKLPITQILDEGPRYRYQADLQYLRNDLKTNNNYLYCLDLIDHFSKWAESYLLFDKTMNSVVSKIKLFILNNGKCRIFQCDNGPEFHIHELQAFLENEEIKLIFLRPRHPQSNGSVEAFHKKVQNYLIKEFIKFKDKFDIKVSLAEFIIYYDNSFNNVTKRKPIEIRNITDLDKIYEINLNIIKSMSPKIRDAPNIIKDDPLLLVNNIKLNNNYISIKLQKKNFLYTMSFYII